MVAPLFLPSFLPFAQVFAVYLRRGVEEHGKLIRPLVHATRCNIRWCIKNCDVSPRCYQNQIQGFWRGYVPALLMVMPYRAIQFAVVHKWKTLVSGSSNSEDHINLSPYLSFVSGGFACAATVVSYPFDLLHTILASQGEPKLFVCGLAAGTCAKTVCHPFDVVNKIFQIVGVQRDPRYGAGVNHHAYRNMYHAVKQILYAEGWAGLYKGIAQSVVIAATASAVTFVAYEFSSKSLQSPLLI